VKVRIFSDLQLEFAAYTPPPAEADVVVLADDTGVGMHGVTWARKAFGDVPVLYIAGNHEYYHHEYPGPLSAMKRRAVGSTVRVLENEVATLDGVAFLACTLWTDFALHGDPELAMGLAQT
jgi:hypothetical protein